MLKQQVEQDLTTVIDDEQSEKFRQSAEDDGEQLGCSLNARFLGVDAKGQKEAHEQANRQGAYGQRDRIEHTMSDFVAPACGSEGEKGQIIIHIELPVSLKKPGRVAAGLVFNRIDYSSPP